MKDVTITPLTRSTFTTLLQARLVSALCVPAAGILKEHFHSPVSFQIFPWMHFLSSQVSSHGTPAYGSGLDSRQNLFSALPLQTERFASPPIYASALHVPAAGMLAAKITP